MNILLAITVVFLSGNTLNEDIGLFKVTEDCQTVGAMIATMAFDNNAVAASYTCIQQTEG